MVLGLFRQRREEWAHALYAAIVAAARAPALYLDYAVPDTVEGRFESLALHTGLVVRRLASEGERRREEARILSEEFFANMDQSLRELGVGPNGVPKRMRGLAAAFYGRLEAYGRALETGDEPGLAAALGRNVYRQTPAPPEALRLARYAITAAARLAALPAADIVAGALAFPDPAAVPMPLPEAADAG